LVGGAFDPDLLSSGGRRRRDDDVGDGDGSVGEPAFSDAADAWPSWEEVVEIASDVDSESR